MNIYYGDSNLMTKYLQVLLKSSRNYTISKQENIFQVILDDKFPSESYDMELYYTITCLMYYRYYRENYLKRWYYDEDLKLQSEELEEGLKEDQLAQVIYDNSLIIKSLSDDSRQVSKLDDRIISLLVGSTITEDSLPKEITDVCKLLNLSTFEYPRKEIEEIQSQFIKSHEILPSGYEGFKVTGYFDPWTRLIVKGGVS